MLSSRLVPISIAALTGLRPYLKCHRVFTIILPLALGSLLIEPLLFGAYGYSVMDLAFQAPIDNSTPSSPFSFGRWLLPPVCAKGGHYKRATYTYHNVTYPPPNPTGKYERVVGPQRWQIKGDYSISEYERGKGKDYSGRGPHMELDVHGPLSISSGLAVIFFHAGCMTWGDRNEMNPCLVEALVKYGVPVVSVSYRLTGWGWNATHIMDDVQRAIFFVERLWPAKKLLLWGESAGAQLALLAAYTNISQHVVGVIADSGQVSMRQSKNCREYSFCRTNYADTSDSCWEQFSPISHVSANSVPTLLYSGEMDEISSPRTSSGLLASSLRELGVLHTWLKPANGRHIAGGETYGPGSVVYQLWEYSFMNMVAFMNTQL